MKEYNIESVDTIWKFHINPDDFSLYIECKTESNEFYLWNALEDHKWVFPKLEKYVCVILHVQYPYVLLSYFHQDNLMNQSILMCYDLINNKELWSSSELKLSEIYKDEIKVYSAKVEPKRFEYINIKNEKINTPILEPLDLDIQNAEKKINTHFLSYNEFEFRLNLPNNVLDEHKSVLQVKSEGVEIINKEFEIEDARTEYDYLMRVENKFILLLSKHKLIIFQS